MEFQYNDGGRKEAGFKGTAGDCVARSISIAAELPYLEVYEALAKINATSRSKCKAAGRNSARNGVDVKCLGFKRYMESIGWRWTPTMQIGSGCKVHLVAEELPAGRLIVAVSKHYTCVIDGVIHDTFNPQRGETVYYKTQGAALINNIERVSPDRCVYGYWSKRDA